MDGLRGNGDNGLASQCRTIDAQHLSLFIDKCTARLPHIQPDVRTDETVDRPSPPGLPGTASTRDDSGTRRDISQSGTSDRQHNFSGADDEIVRTWNRCQLIRVNAKHGEIGCCIAPDPTCAERFSGENDLDVLAKAKAVMRRYDHARLPNHSARSRSSSALNRDNAVLKIRDGVGK